jgi:hypothetical protein
LQKLCLLTLNPAVLAKWNFLDEATNSTTQQINRQKSARNLVVQQFDASQPMGVFFDPVRREVHKANLTQCDCHDFNFAGASPRKMFRPCMHIYRLAMELGLIEAKYLDHRARAAWAGALAEEEAKRLQGLPRDSGQWGNWATAIHRSGVQQNRQYRAYSLIHEEQDATLPASSGWLIHGYVVTLSSCECMDFFDRRLPCKHIYAAAIESNIPLPLTLADYESSKNRGLTLVFEFPEEA